MVDAIFYEMLSLRNNIFEFNSRYSSYHESQKKQVIRTDNDREEVVFDCLRAAAADFFPRATLARDFSYTLSRLEPH